MFVECLEAKHNKLWLFIVQYFIKEQKLTISKHSKRFASLVSKSNSKGLRVSCDNYNEEFIEKFETPNIAKYDHIYMLNNCFTFSGQIQLIAEETCTLIKP